MSRSDDPTNRTRADEFPTQGPENRSSPQARSFSESRLRLVSSRQVVTQSHPSDLRQKWRIRKIKNCNCRRFAKFDYNARVKTPTSDRQLTAAEATAEALRQLVPRRGWSEAAQTTGIANGTLRRLRDGQASVKDEQVRALRRYPGFSALFDELTGSEVDEDYAEAARRLAEAFPDGSLETLVYQLENAARLGLDAEQIASSLKSVVAVARAAQSSQKKSPVLANKTRETA